MKSIRLKIILLIFGCSIGILLVSLSITIFSTLRYSSNQLLINKDTIYSDYDKNIKNQIENIISLIDAVYKHQKSINADETTGMELARKLIRGIRYDSNGYFWIDDINGINVCNPSQPETEGKSRLNFKDVHGKEIFKEFIEKARNQGGGYTDYWFPRPGETKPSPKRGYTTYFEPYKWIVGTGNYIDDMEKVVMKQQEASNENIKQLLILVFIIAVILSIIATSISIFFGNSISKPIIEASKTANDLAKGDLTVRVDKHFESRNDEIGLLIRSLNNANDTLEKMVAALVFAMHNLYTAVQEINQSNMNLSQRTTEQASSLEEIASTIEQTSSTIIQNTDNSHNANNASIASSQYAEKGGELVTESVQAINEISSSSKKIGEIISVINEIAFQTNLLALNAAVEAARAGDQGRGFAVVAGEVRNLAQRAAAAAKEINALITDSLARIDAGTDLANKSGEAIKEIIHSSKNVTKLITEITLASEEQKSGMEQINIAISDLDSMTQQNAALVEETASASEEMTSQALELINMTKAFKFTGMDDAKIKEVTNDKIMAPAQPVKTDKGNGKKPIKPVIATEKIETQVKTDKAEMDDFDIF